MAYKIGSLDPKIFTPQITVNFSYGFDTQRSMKALERTDRDVGQALELLLSECFDLPLKKSAAVLHDRCVKCRD